MLLQKATEESLFQQNHIIDDIPNQVSQTPAWLNDINNPIHQIPQTQGNLNVVTHSHTFCKTCKHKMCDSFIQTDIHNKTTQTNNIANTAPMCFSSPGLNHYRYSTGSLHTLDQISSICSFSNKQLSQVQSSYSSQEDESSDEHGTGTASQLSQLYLPDMSDIFCSVANISSTDESYETTFANNADRKLNRSPRKSEIQFKPSYEYPKVDFSRSQSMTKISSWYQQSLKRSYKTKVSHFKRIFRGTPVDTDRLLVDYACALSKKNNGFLFQGRMYITQNWICFYSKIIYEQKIYLAVEDILSVTKAKTARLIPNAIQIVCKPDNEVYFFTSFAARERAFAILKKVCTNEGKQMDGVESMEDLLCQVQDVYGDESIAVIEDYFESPDSALLLKHSSSSDNNAPNKPNSWKNQNSDEIPVCKHVNEPSSNSPIEKQETMKKRPLDEVYEKFSNDDLNESDTSEDAHPTNLPSDGICINFPERPYNQPPKSSMKDALKFGRIRRRKCARIRENLSIGYTPANLENVEKVTVTQMNHGPAFCGNGHSHFSRVYADVAINLSVDALFACLFTDSQFLAQFNTSRGTFNITNSQWPPQPWPTVQSLNSVECPTYQRTITYTLSLRQRLGPRTCSATEQQSILLKETTPGMRYVVDSKVTNEAVPLCNCFHVIIRYCLLRRNATVSQLIISSEVVYDQPVFFGAKSIIESTCKSSLTENFTDLVNQLSANASQLCDKERISGGLLAKPQKVKNCLPKLNDSNLNDGERDSSNEANLSRISIANQYDLKKDPYIHNSTPHKSTNLLNSELQNQKSLGNHLYQSDNKWLFVITVSLVLCVCLSVVYNRYLDLEKLTSSIKLSNMAGSLKIDPMYVSQNNKLHNSGCSEELQTIRALIKSVSSVVDQMQTTLNVLEKRLLKLTPNYCQTESEKNVLSDLFRL